MSKAVLLAYLAQSTTTTMLIMKILGTEITVTDPCKQSVCSSLASDLTVIRIGLTDLFFECDKCDIVEQTRDELSVTDAVQAGAVPVNGIHNSSHFPLRLVDTIGLHDIISSESLVSC